MIYVDKEYYKNVFKGTLIDDDRIEKELSNAQDDIDTLTFNRIVAKGFTNLTSFQQDRVKKAVCEQADYMTTHHDYLNLPVNSFSAGSVSMSLKILEVDGINTSNKVLHLLDQTGLRCLRV